MRHVLPTLPAPGTLERSAEAHLQVMVIAVYSMLAQAVFAAITLVYVLIIVSRPVYYMKGSPGSSVGRNLAKGRLSPFSHAILSHCYKEDIQEMACSATQERQDTRSVWIEEVQHPVQEV